MTNKPVVLIADDSSIARRGLKNRIDKDKYQIIEAVGGNDALEKIKFNKIDCILLDLLMPDIDGFEVLEQLHNSNNQIPIIIISADIQESTRNIVIEKGAFDFLNKPPLSDDLNDTLNRALNRK